MRMSPLQIDLDELVRQIREQEASFEQEGGQKEPVQASVKVAPRVGSKKGMAEIDLGIIPKNPPFWTGERKGLMLWGALLLLLAGVIWWRMPHAPGGASAGSSDPTRINLDSP